uniref:hypothetical protein n=1 Tax=uncultured Caulobacter sp. TaxID=158749 RepID=UPI0025F33698|nr:hypothetical protein [uncultured Caulobacter sp.]
MAAAVSDVGDGSVEQNWKGQLKLREDEGFRACSPVLNLAVRTIPSLLAPVAASVAALVAFVAAVLMVGGPGVWRRLGLPIG